MIPSKNLIDLLKIWEGCKLKSYKDSAGIWTIGVGSITYQSGKHVGPAENISQQQADDLLMWELSNKGAVLNNLLKGVSVNQNQYDALLSFTFNVGVGAIAGSTLLKRVKANTNDPSIKDAFLMWDKIHLDGKLVEVPGLRNRRMNEIKLYFTPS